MSYTKFKKNPFIIFLPFLVLYIFVVLFFPTNAKFGDESRYIIHVNYMLHGNFPVGEENFDVLGNGPGYALILIPFVALELPLICITLLNGLLFYFSIILIFKTLQKLATFKATMLVCLFWGFYLNMYECIIKILPETLVSFLICLLAYAVINAFTGVKPGKYLWISGITFGYIVLTKPIFGYVLLVLFAGVMVCWLIKRNVKVYRQALLILIVSLATITPYLIYSYNLSGKIFYMSSFGGTSLYWMTTPHEKEYGSWFPDVLENTPVGRGVDSGFLKDMASNYEEDLKVGHQNNFKEITRYTKVQKDDAFKRIAVENIKNHPVKFIKNCISNLGRILFNFPYSYKFQDPDTLIRLPFNGVIIALILFCMLPALRNWSKVNFSIRFLFFFALIYLGGSIFGSAETRMFTIIVPILLIWIAVICKKVIKVNFAKWENI